MIKTGEKEKEEDLNFSYNEIEINKELTFNELIYDIDKKEKKVNIIVTKVEEEQNKTKEKISKDVISKEIISKEIYCPEQDCKEPVLIDINSFRINFKECKNKHQINNIPLKDYEKSQTINQEDIKCDLCYIKNKSNTPNNEFYFCNTCSKSICPSCKSTHDENHIIINYEDKNYLCRKHNNEQFFKYCETCKEDICIQCINEDEHKGHNFIDFEKIFIKNDELLKSVEDLNDTIENFKHKIDIIKDIFDRMINTFDLYYKINKDIINNYNINNKRNYYKLQNLKYLKNNNKEIINYINNIINNNDIFKIYKLPNDKFYYYTFGIYLCEMENDLKEEKGIFYFNKAKSIKYFHSKKLE